MIFSVAWNAIKCLESAVSRGEGMT